jgi:uncharacterized protein with GYD domain
MMETYVIAGNYTQEGVRQIKERPAGLDELRKGIEAAGGKLLSFYLTMGRYDFVITIQVPDARTAAAVLLVIGARGYARTETMRALTEEEFKGVVVELP